MVDYPSSNNSNNKVVLLQSLVDRSEKHVVHLKSIIEGFKWVIGLLWIYFIFLLGVVVIGNDIGDLVEISFPIERNTHR